MKKFAKNSIFSILSLLCVLTLVSCDGGDGGDGGGGGTSGGNDEVLGDGITAPDSLFTNEKIEYYDLNTSDVRDTLRFSAENTTDPINKANKVYVYSNDVGGPQNFQLKATGEEGLNETQAEKLRRLVLELISPPTDSNTDFKNFIRDGNFSPEEMADILNRQSVGGAGFVVVRDGNLIAPNGPVFYDHTIDSDVEALLVAGVIEGVYNQYTTDRIITFRNASDEERDILELSNNPQLNYTIPTIENESDNLVNLIADGVAQLKIAGARFKISVIADNTGR